MKEWILVLSLFGAWTDDPKFMLKVEGFETQEKCLNAGNIWLKDIRDGLRNARDGRNIGTIASAVCMQK